MKLWMSIFHLLQSSTAICPVLASWYACQKAICSYSAIAQGVLRVHGGVGWRSEVRLIVVTSGRPSESSPHAVFVCCRPFSHIAPTHIRLMKGRGTACRKHIFLRSNDYAKYENPMKYHS